jgi:hypothetical protein
MHCYTRPELQSKKYTSLWSKAKTILGSSSRKSSILLQRAMRSLIVGFSLGLLLLPLLGCATQARATERYPQEALKCHSSTSADGEIICPIDRNNYCIKEESTTSRGDCGTVYPYRFDVWDRRLGKCVYRKCAAACLTDAVTTFGDAQQYSRTTYCCTSNRCNGATDHAARSALAITLSVGVLAYLLR